MGYGGDFQSWQVTATNDLSDTTPSTGAIFKAVSYVTGDIAANAIAAGGVLQYTASSGGHATLGMYGVMKATFQTIISSIGMNLTVATSGYMKVAGSGDFVVGRNLTAVTCGEVAAMFANFLNPWYYNLTDNTSGT